MTLPDEAANGLTELKSNFQGLDDTDDLCLGSGNYYHGLDFNFHGGDRERDQRSEFIAEVETHRAPGATDSPHRLQNSAVPNCSSFFSQPYAQPPAAANLGANAAPLGMGDQNYGQYVLSHQHSYNYDTSYPMRHDTVNLNEVASCYPGLYGNFRPAQHNDMWYSGHGFRGSWLANSAHADRLAQGDQILPSMQPSSSYSSGSGPHLRSHPSTQPDESHTQQTKGNQRPARGPKTFPQKLMSVLLQNPRDDAFVWTQDESSFIVVDRDIFVSAVLNKAFNNTKFSSFVRKLHRWGFVRLVSGVPANCFHHPLFTKNCPQNVVLIACVSQQGTRKTTNQAPLPMHSASSAVRAGTGTRDCAGTGGGGRETTGENERGVVMTIHLPSQKLTPHSPDRWR